MTKTYGWMEPGAADEAQPGAVAKLGGEQRSPSMSSSPASCVPAHPGSLECSLAITVSRSGWSSPRLVDTPDLAQNGPEIARNYHGKNTYADEFKADAVQLDEGIEGASLSSIAVDLRISRSTLLVRLATPYQGQVRASGVSALSAKTA